MNDSSLRLTEGGADMAAVSAEKEGGTDKTVGRTEIAVERMKVALVEQEPDSVREEERAGIEEQLFRIFGRYVQ